jgi:hypothetical protein
LRPPPLPAWTGGADPALPRSPRESEHDPSYLVSQWSTRARRDADSPWASANAPADRVGPLREPTRPLWRIAARYGTCHT